MTRLPSLLALAAFAVSGVLAAPSVPSAAEGTVRIYNWSDYIDESILEAFTAETGIETVYDTFDSNEILETKLLAGSTGYDIVVPTGSFLARQIQAGVFKPLDKEKIPALANLDPGLMERVSKHDPGNEHAAIYMWGTTGIAYNVDKIRERMPDAPVDSLSLIMDPEIVKNFADCGIFLLDAPDEIFPPTLKYLGLDPDSKDPADLEAAAAHLMKIRPYIRKFHSSEVINAIATGDICLAIMWSGDAGIAAARAEEAGNGVNVAYTIPKEGALLWFDMLAIPADAPNPDAAYAFINYILQPEVIAQATNYVTYPNAVPGSLEFTDEQVRDDPNVYPPEDVMNNLFTVTAYDLRTQRVLNSLWSNIRAGG